MAFSSASVIFCELFCGGLKRLACIRRTSEMLPNADCKFAAGHLCLVHNLAGEVQSVSQAMDTACGQLRCDLAPDLFLHLHASLILLVIFRSVKVDTSSRKFY